MGLYVLLVIRYCPAWIVSFQNIDGTYVPLITGHVFLIALERDDAASRGDAGPRSLLDLGVSSSGC